MEVQVAEQPPIRASSDCESCGKEMNGLGWGYREITLSLTGPKQGVLGARTKKFPRSHYLGPSLKFSETENRDWWIYTRIRALRYYGYSPKHWLELENKVKIPWSKLSITREVSTTRSVNRIDNGNQHDVHNHYGGWHRLLEACACPFGNERERQ